MTLLNEKTRLNAQIRQNIITNAIESSGVNAEKRAIIDARAQFCEDVVAAELARLKLTQADIRARYDDLQKDNDIDDNFFGLSVGVNWANPGGYSTPVDANVCGMRLYLYPNGARTSGKETHLKEENTPHLRHPRDGGNFYPKEDVTIADQAFADRWMAIEARQKAVDAKEHDVKQTLTASLAKFSTIGKLLAAWPEAKDLLPKELVVSTGVALSADTLNALCGLPK